MVDWLREALSEFYEKVMGWVTDFLEWLVDFLLYVPKKVFELMMAALGDFLKNLPVPDFFNNVSWGVLDSGVAWFASVAQFEIGIPMVFGALLLRFLLRRIPLIG